MYAHRLAFIFMTGECPAFVDHRNTVKSDNKWGNLRSATRAQNERNKGVTNRNTSGIKGIYFSKKLGKWTARIGYQGKSKHLGVFDTKELAAEFRQLAADMLHGEFVRHV